MGENFSILNKTKNKTPKSVSFLTKLKNYSLGKNFELSLVLINSKKSTQLNKTYKNKNKPTNVLSFPLSKTSGEIFIDMMEIKKQAKDFNLTNTNFFIMLFIHAMCHLKGMQHSSKMEREEKKIQKKFNLNF